MKYEQIIGGDGISGQKGLQVRNIINSQFQEVMGDIEYIPYDFNWTSDLSSYSGSTLKITHEHDIEGGNITLPSNSILLFEGGKLLNVGNLSGNTSKILNLKNLQCFDLNVNFIGSWIDTIITPQCFGAICNINPNTFLNSSSDAIQKVFDSPFLPYFPNGYYYLTEPITITRQVYADFGLPVHEMIDEMSSFVFRNDHVRFYSNLDINFWQIREHGVYLVGGVMDIRNIKPFTKAVYHYHGDYKCNMGECSGYVIGSLSAIRTEGSTGKAIHWDCSNVTQNWGYISTLDWHIKVIYCPFGIVIDKSSDSGRTGTWCTALKISGVFDGCKKALVINDGSTTTIAGYTQTRAVLTEEEKEYYQVEIGAGVTLNMFNWDLSSSLENGFYYPKNGTLIKSNGVVLEGLSLKQLPVYQIKYDNSYVELIQPQPITQKNKMRLLRQRWSRETFISELHNSWLGLDKLYTVTVKAYDGSSIDFDSEDYLMDGYTLGLPEASGITFVDVKNLFTANGNPFRYYTQPSSDIDNNFVEIYITGSSISVNETFLSLIYSYGVPKKIQFFGIKSDSSVVLLEEDYGIYSSWYGRPSFKFNFSSAGFDKFIIRIIGQKMESQSYYNGTLNLTTGQININIETGLTFEEDQNLCISYSNEIYMTGTTVDYDSTTGNLIFNVDWVSDTGSYDTWRINPNRLISTYIDDLSNFSTGFVQNYVGKLDYPRYSYKGIISQTGTTEPWIVSELLNTTNQTVYCTYVGVGQYRLYCSYRLISNKTDPVNRIVDIGNGNTLTISRTNTDRFLLETKNSSGVLTDDLLTNVTVSFDVYW